MTHTAARASERRTSLVAGAIGSLMAAALLAAIIGAQGMTGQVEGLAGLPASDGGLLLHLLLVAALGAGFGALVRYQPGAYAATMSYGFFWWVLGPLTLMPRLLGSPPQWNIQAATAAAPSLIGHVLYGVGLALTFLYLEARHNPWWQLRRKVEAERAQRRREQLFTASPALWVMIILISLTLSVVLSHSGGTPPGGINVY